MSNPDITELTITVTEFKAKCLDLFKRLEQGELGRVTVTRRGKPIADVAARSAERKTFDEIYGCMKGTITIAPAVDLTEAVISPEEWDAERGILVNDKP